MRRFVLVVALGLLVTFASPLVLVSSSAAPIPKYSIIVDGQTEGTVFSFNPERILLPQLPIVVNVTFRNVNATAGIDHTFTINNATGAPKVDTGIVAAGANASVEFTVNALDNVTFGSEGFAPERKDDGIRFHCKIHPTMEGVIALAAPTPGEIPKVYMRILGETVNGKQVFSPSQVLLPQVPVTLNITFINNESAGGQMHTFTMKDSGGTPFLDSDLLMPGEQRTFEFTINSMDNVTYQGVSHAPFKLGSGVYYYCIPHEAAGMFGSFVLASALAETTTPEKGILLRAYWIGMIGIFAMILWIGIAYFVIKSSSPHFKDHKEHVRKGLP